MILSGVAWKGNLTDNCETSHPRLVNDRYKMCHNMPNHCSYSKTNKECGLHKVHAPDNLSDVLQVCIAILPIYNNT